MEIAPAASPPVKTQPRANALWELLRQFVRLFLLAFFALELFFFVRIALYPYIAPQSTTFQRSWMMHSFLKSKSNSSPAAPAISKIKPDANMWWKNWRQKSVALEKISEPMQRAVLAAEDAGFVLHAGVAWESLSRAWEKNQTAREKSYKMRTHKSAKPAPLVGGSSITQQLAKNLFLNAEQNLARKAQELILTFFLEALLDKAEILNLYLNNVEWGNGVWGVEAAAQKYWRVPSSNLESEQAARLALCLPRPKYFERIFHTSVYLDDTTLVRERMLDVALP